MFVVCLECFRVIAAQGPLGNSAVIPSLCPACQMLADMTRERLGLPTGGLKVGTQVALTQRHCP